MKDLIIRAGQHVHPHELEAAAGAVPGVRRGCVAAFGVPDERTHTERVVLVAETRAPEAERPALARRILDAVTPVMGEPPDDVVVAAPHAVPRTPSGKIRRSACRDLYLRGGLAQRATPRRTLRAWLAAGVVVAGVRRLAAACATLAFAAWFWLVVGLAFLLGWPAVRVTPGAARRRAVLRGVARAALFLLGGFVAAARAGVAVVPVTFVGTRTALRGDQWFPRRAHVVVCAFPPVAPGGAAWADALHLRDGVRAAMLPSLGEPDLAAE